MKKITAIIREDTQDKLIDELQKHGVPGVSIAQVKGYGEYINTYSQDSLETCIKVEIFTQDKVARQVATLIMDLSATGVEGDGVVAITPVDVIYRVRDKQQLQD